MKVDAKVEWLVDEVHYGITAGMDETVTIDSDYVEANESDIMHAVEDELWSKHGFAVHGSAKPGDDNDASDFVVTNMSELIEELAYDEFCERVE